MTTEHQLRAWRLPDLPPPSAPPPAVTRETMAAVDRIATDSFNLSLLQMMENAGRSMATLAFATIDGPRRGSSRLGRVVVLAGTGNNAGGGLVAARHLASWGIDVEVVFARPALRLRPAPCQQLDLAVAAGVGVGVAGHDRRYDEVADLVRTSDVVIDALIGYNLTGAPDAAYQALIDLAGAGDGPVLSLDLPSGVDATTGARPGAAIGADATLTLALPKTGFLHEPARTVAGRVYLADIGIPRDVFAAAGIDLPIIFGRGPIVRIGRLAAASGADA
jgi:NAD(P)H-hydrate epimerase